MKILFKPESIRQQEKAEFRQLSSEGVFTTLDEKPIKLIQEELLLDKILTQGLEVPDHQTG